MPSHELPRRSPRAVGAVGARRSRSTVDELTQTTNLMPRGRPRNRRRSIPTSMGKVTPAHSSCSLVQQKEPIQSSQPVCPKPGMPGHVSPPADEIQNCSLLHIVLQTSSFRRTAPEFGYWRAAYLLVLADGARPSRLSAEVHTCCTLPDFSPIVTARFPLLTKMCGIAVPHVVVRAVLF
jgi:hypothetical protein